MKLARKGRKPVEGARIAKDLSWAKASFADRLLITQAARLADRLEVIARLLSGDAAAWLVVKVAGQALTLDVAAVVREERQLSETLRKLIGDIEKRRAEAEGGQGSGGPEKAVDPVERIVTEHYGGKRA